jgi:effector-binding domain-containing protein
MGRTTRVSGILFVAAWGWLTEKTTYQNKIKKELQSLKLFVEDPLTFYGFPIEIRPVSDSLIMTRQLTVKATETSLPLRQIYSDLTDYARTNQLIFKTYRYVSFKETDSGKIRLAVGIPVNKRGQAAEGIRFLEMPVGGRLLVGNTTGSPSRIKALYAAMEKYMKDKNLKRVADPLEKYEYFPRSAQDSLHIKVEVQIPIY